MAETATASVDATIEENSAACCQCHPRSCMSQDPKSLQLPCNKRSTAESFCMTNDQQTELGKTHRQAEHIQQHWHHEDRRGDHHQKCKCQHLQHDLQIVNAR